MVISTINNRRDMIPLSVIKDDNDHTMHYAQSLPYAHLLDKEAESWLNDICTNLVISVKAQDFHGGVLAWVKRLSSYMDMKHAIPRKTRAHLAKLLYELVIMPGMDSALIELWAQSFMRLVKHRHRLDSEDLQLDWRPLYNMLEKKVFSGTGQKLTLSETKHLGSVLSLIRYAKRFFSVDTAKELLEEFLPKYNANSMADAAKAQGYLLTFLPYEDHPKDTLHIEDYLSTIFSLWSMIPCSLTTDNVMMNYISRIAEHNMEKGTQIALFTKQQVKFIFTLGLRMMNLPVGSRGDGISPAGGTAGSTITGYGPVAIKNDNKAGTALSFGRNDKFKAFARFIVYTIIPDENYPKNSYTLSRLSDFVQASELYFHPSNHGPWSLMLTMFMRSLASEFLKRWRREHEDENLIPDSRRLTAEIRKQFTMILRPVAYLSMFGRDPYSISYTQSTLKYLSWLEPSIVLPGLLERIYPSLETLTETHRTSSALGILTDIALPLITRENYPAGGKHLLPLLHLAIPGIDMNDPSKTIQSFLFISTALMTVPIIDLTQHHDDYYPTEDNVDDLNANLSRETEDYFLKITTGEFEEWLAKFMNRVFTIFENLPQESRKKQSVTTSEAKLIQILLHTCDIIFGQLSDELYDLALKLVSDFVTDRVLPNATRAVGLLCDTLTNKNPQKAAKIFIPICISNIQIELEHGASSIVSHADGSNLIQSDSTFHWYQNILYSVICNIGPEILTYRNEIVSICQLMVDKCRSRRGIMWTGKTLRNILNSILNVYPTEFRSLNPEIWNNKEFMIRNAHSMWGKPGDPKNLEIQWHVPSETEKNFALEFLNLFLTPSITRLNELMNISDINAVDSYQLSNELCRHLAVVRNCLIGSSMLVAEDSKVNGDCIVTDEEDEDTDLVEDIDDELTDNDDDDDFGDPEPAAPPKRLEVGYTFTDPQDPRMETALQFRYSIGTLIHQLFEFFRVKRETDLENVKILIKIARTFLSVRGIEKAQFDLSKDGYSYAKKLVRNPFLKKCYPRNLLVRRAYNHHLLRLRQNTQGRTRTPVHDAILLDLLQFSLIPYDEIRAVSRSALTASARCFRNARALFIPELLEALNTGSSIDRIKGALHLLTHRSVLMACIRDWRFVPKFIKAFCNTYEQDDAVVQELISHLSLQYASNFSPISFQTLVPDYIDDLLRPLSALALNDSNSQAKIEETLQKVEGRKAQIINNYNQLLDFLLEYLDDQRIHWRYAGMASEFVELFLRPDIKPTGRLAAFANKCVLSEIPGIRKIGINATTQILQFIEQRTLIEGDEKLLITQEIPNPLKIDLQVHDTTNGVLSSKLLSSLYSTVNAENSSATVFLDDPALGWYVWPEKYTAYKVNQHEVLLSSFEPESRDAYEEFAAEFIRDDYWAKLCSYLSQEAEKRDRFSSVNARLFKYIFRTFGDAPLTVAKGHIEKLCEDFDQKNSQRAASEILAGLIRGMKHWNLRKSELVWQWLVILIQKVFKSITPDSLVYWDSFVRFVSYRRDPRRIQPLIDLIVEDTLDPLSDAAFNESRKLLLTRALLSTLQWRSKPLCQKLLLIYLNNINHPYKQVREVIGSNINVIHQIEWLPAFGSVEQLLLANKSTDGIGNVPSSLTYEQQERIDAINSKLDSWFTEVRQSKTLMAGSRNYAHGSKTVLQWLYEASIHWSACGTLPYIKPMFLRLFEMQEIHDDQDLQLMATRVLSSVSRINYPPAMIPDLIDQLIVTLTTSGSWHMRIRALPVLQVFFFKHIFLLDKQHIVRIMETVGQMLMDSQIEVRQLASETLGGLVRCSQRDAIKKLLTQFLAKVDVRLPKRMRDKVTGKNIEPEGFAEATLSKHSGVLGISCLIGAFPYEVPEWMPSTLCKLAGCMAEPAAEIQATVRKTFSDFRRTHSDTWHEDMHKFTSDQLSILSDMLISPTYYA
ncbi:hypothetical protein BDF20DRAFT_879640 [Mycotypha africana]|uniref:uncharacterized protein n=1 Tax=Mycotypha africana TaxID=64632 RepID=UPI0023013CB4|nr:uncharacterized protein BDF20DRAFT_879640 [Mycotypha africana]KAI8975614.1 hypothetical protein BDF20DRAFT_879640 [Mycotypha africana]